MAAMPYTVVKIEGESYQRPGAINSGTGFFYRVDSEFGPILVIATNKHVIDGLDVLRFHMALADENGKRVFAPAELKDVQVAEYPIFRHPDPKVDLALIACEPLIDDIVNRGQKPYVMPLTAKNLPPDWMVEKLTALTNVVMVGFPNGLMDTVNNLPISRRGTLSTHYFADYNGEKNFVVDIAAFGGSSGSPVFAHFEIKAPTKTGFNIGEGAAYFIGILHSGPTLSAQGQVISEPVPTSRQITQTSLMMHLGFCAKAELLQDFIPLVDEFIRNNPGA